MASIILSKIASIIRGYVSSNVCQEPGKRSNVVLVVLFKIRKLGIGIEGRRKRCPYTQFGDLLFVHYRRQPAALAAPQAAIMCLDEHLGRSHAGQFLLEREFRLRRTELRDGKFACRNIDIGDTYGVASHNHACEKVV